MTAKRRRGRLPAASAPLALERSVGGETWRLVKPGIRRALALIASGLRGLRPDDPAQDADDGVDALVERGIVAATKAIPRARASAIATRAAAAASKHGDAALARQVKAATGVDLPPLARLGPILRARAIEHAQAITTIPRRHLTQVAGDVRRALRDGTSVETLAEQLRATYLDDHPRGERIALNIARDQTQRLIADQTAARHEELSIRRYVWATSLDERVRGNPGGLYPNANPSHWARERKVFSWAKPPKGGHPGEAAFCRCWAEPVIDAAAVAAIEDLAGEE